MPSPLASPPSLFFLRGDFPVTVSIFDLVKKKAVVDLTKTMGVVKHPLFIFQRVWL